MLGHYLGTCGRERNARSFQPLGFSFQPKKSKRASSRGVTKRGSLIDDDTNSPKPSIDNESSDNVVEPTYIPQEPRDYATNVTTDATRLFH